MWRKEKTRSFTISSLKQNYSDIRQWINSWHQLRFTYNAMNTLHFNLALNSSLFPYVVCQGGTFISRDFNIVVFCLSSISVFIPHLWSKKRKFRHISVMVDNTVQNTKRASKNQVKIKLSAEQKKKGLSCFYRITSMV